MPQSPPAKRRLFPYLTRVVKNNQIPFLVAKCGRYYNLSGLKPGKHGTKPNTPISGTDGVGNKLTFEKYDDSTFGYLLLTLSAKQVTCKFMGVNIKTRATSAVDHFTLDLVHHTVSKR